MALFGAFAALTSPDGASAVAAAGRLAGVLLGLAVAVEYPAALAARSSGAAAVGRARRPAGDLLRLLAGARAAPAAAGGLPAGRLRPPLGHRYAHLDPASVYAAGQAGALLGVGCPARTSPWPCRPGCAGACSSTPPGCCWPSRAPSCCGAATGRRRRRRWASWGPCWRVNSGYVFWDGGASWGPRHLVPALPFLALLALPAAARWPRGGAAPGGALRAC